MGNTLAVAAPNEPPHIESALMQRVLENSIRAELTVNLNADAECTRAARIWSASDSFLRLIVDTPVDLGANAEVRFEGCRTCGEIAFCQPSPGGYNVGIQLGNDSSVRREPRFPIQLSGTLTVLGDHGPQRIQIELVDVSASGVGMTAPEPIPVGFCVEIDLATGALFGEIRHCDRDENGRYRAGVKMYHMVEKELQSRSKPGSNLLGWFRRAKQP